MLVRLTHITVSFALAAMLAGGAALAGHHGPRVKGFRPLTTLNVEGTAEIEAATPDGMTLVYTDSDNGSVGFVDITDPENPAVVGSAPVNVSVKRFQVSHPPVHRSPESR